MVGSTLDAGVEMGRPWAAGAELESSLAVREQVDGAFAVLATAVTTQLVVAPTRGSHLLEVAEALQDSLRTAEEVEALRQEDERLGTVAPTTDSGKSGTLLQPPLAGIGEGAKLTLRTMTGGEMARNANCPSRFHPMVGLT